VIGWRDRKGMEMSIYGNDLIMLKSINTLVRCMDHGRSLQKGKEGLAAMELKYSGPDILPPHE